MSHVPKLVGERCYLAPVEASDAELWTRWLNDLEVALPLGDEAYAALTLEGERRDVAEIAARAEPVFTIVERESDRAIGRCLLFNVNKTDRWAMAGIFIGEKDCRGRGLGTEAMRLLLDYAFNLLNLHSVMLGVFDFNARAIASYRSIGFREIGRRRDARLIAGEWHDEVLMDIVAEEFESPYVARVAEEVGARRE